jgi:signal peptidase I
MAYRRITASLPCRYTPATRSLPETLTRPGVRRESRGMIWAAASVGLLAAGVGVLRYRWLVVTVDGDSMSPSLAHGDRVLVVRGRMAPRVGDVVVFKLPGTSTRPSPGTGSRSGRGNPPAPLIKRIAAVAGDDVPQSVADAVGSRPGTKVPERSLVVIGDAPGSADSRIWGYLATRDVVGVVARRLAPRD